MATYRLCCALSVGCSAGSHVVKVGASNTRFIAHFTPTEIWRAMAEGDWFYTRGELGIHTMIRALRCACGEPSLRARSRRGSTEPIEALPRCEHSARPRA